MNDAAGQALAGARRPPPAARGWLLSGLLLFAPGCFAAEDGRSGQISIAAANTRMAVVWERVPAEQVDIVCRVSGVVERYRMGGCAIVTEQGCRIIAPAPDDWSDESRLSVLGHELVHCYGASHGHSRAAAAPEAWH